MTQELTRTVYHSKIALDVCVTAQAYTDLRRANTDEPESSCPKGRRRRRRRIWRYREGLRHRAYVSFERFAVLCGRARASRTCGTRWSPSIAPRDVPRVGSKKKTALTTGLGKADKASLVKGYA